MVGLRGRQRDGEREGGRKEDKGQTPIVYFMVPDIVCEQSRKTTLIPPKGNIYKVFCNHFLKDLFVCLHIINTYMMSKFH